MIPVVAFVMIVMFVGGVLFGAAVSGAFSAHADCAVECRHSSCAREADPYEFEPESF